MDDLLWPHFSPLWRELSTIPSPNILVAGGYGLFLKQRWLRSSPRLSTVVPIENWLDVDPRVTKDVDLVLGLDLIRNQNRQEFVVRALEKSGFVVSERLPEQRWKFIKRLEDSPPVIVEMHAQLPAVDDLGIKATNKRIKHKPSLGAQGVHGRTNPEAVGSELHPFQFSLADVNLIVPNPVTWSVMKLTATSDRWASSQDLELEEEPREFCRLQAAKHAQDVYRVIAMMTLEERDRASEVIDLIVGTDAFVNAKQCWQNHFADSPIPVVRQLEAKWLSDDAITIQQVLSGWFG